MALYDFKFLFYGEDPGLCSLVQAIHCELYNSDNSSIWDLTALSISISVSKLANTHSMQIADRVAIPDP